MSAVDPAGIARVAALARVEVEPDAMPVLVGQITRILDYVSQIDAVQGDQDSADGPFPWTGPAARLRNDEPRDDAPIDLAALTDALAGRLVIVPLLPGVD